MNVTSRWVVDFESRIASLAKPKSNLCFPCYEQSTHKLWKGAKQAHHGLVHPHTNSHWWPSGSLIRCSDHETCAKNSCAWHSTQKTGNQADQQPIVCSGHDEIGHNRKKSRTYEPTKVQWLKMKRNDLLLIIPIARRHKSHCLLHPTSTARNTAWTRSELLGVAGHISRAITWEVHTRQWPDTRHHRYLHCKKSRDLSSIP